MSSTKSGPSLLTLQPYNPKGKRETYRIAILGDEGVGKTALVQRYLNGVFSETYNPTMEDWHISHPVMDGRICTLEILDTGGNEAYSTPLLESWIRSVDGLLLVYSVTRRLPFTKTRTWHRAILQASSASGRGRGGGAEVMMRRPAVVLVGSRADRVWEREVSAEEGRALARALEMKHVECSAAIQEGHAPVADAFRAVVRMMQQQRAEAHRARLLRY
ncbi:P-loop containing nucleoside triphosphate hydrolase protein [Chaetomium fimeti]|uniref:P-loop containing nucleoside triphosphate hydrolase protein n=1 Tax=Chaetomium fimeti TaxID=1854472 RepID=A0AAE0HMW2_9PEZI|nr:P-loop containing nucleoside triphosphate hydrolase protein [Chaetomium fimeti]